MESVRSDLSEDITAVKTEIKSEIEVVNENLGYIEGKIVAFEDGMENIGKDVSQASKEKVDSNSLHLGNEVNTLKSEFRNYSHKIEDLENTVSNLTTLITSLTTMLEKN